MVQLNGMHGKILLNKGGGMAGPLEQVTKVAVRELIFEKTKKSRFGYFLSEEGLEDIVDEIARLIVTSRDLKNAGDRLLSEGPEAFKKSRRQRPFA